MRNNLIEFRKKVGLTQEEMGSLVKCSRYQYCNVEAAKREGSPDMWLDIGILFNLSVQQLKKLREVS